MRVLLCLRSQLCTHLQARLFIAFASDADRSEKIIGTGDAAALCGCHRVNRVQVGAPLDYSTVSYIKAESPFVSYSIERNPRREQQT